MAKLEKHKLILHIFNLNMRNLMKNCSKIFKVNLVQTKRKIPNLKRNSKFLLMRIIKKRSNSKLMNIN